MTKEAGFLLERIAHLDEYLAQKHTATCEKKDRVLGTNTRIISIHESAMDKKEERREPEPPTEKEMDSVIPEFSIEYKRDV